MRKRQDGTVSIESEDFGIEELPAEAEDIWEKQWRATVLAQALLEIKQKCDPTTYQSYMYFALQDMSAQEVANLLDIKPNAVYQHKARIERMMQKFVMEFDQ